MRLLTFDVALTTSLCARPEAPLAPIRLPAGREANETDASRAREDRAQGAVLFGREDRSPQQAGSRSVLPLSLSLGWVDLQAPEPVAEL